MRRTATSSVAENARDPARLSVILRAMPPAFAGGLADTGELRAYYYDRLWREWTPRQRLAALALNGAPNGATGIAMRAWRLGFRRRNLAEIEARQRREARFGAFLDQDERKGLHAIINAAGLPLQTNILKNKALFESHCRQAGLPLPPSVETAEDARSHDALISKPRFGSKGKGVQKLVRQTDGGFRSSEGRLRVEAGDVAAWLARERAAGRIVQRCMAAHETVRAISPGALPTLRIVTVKDEHGAPEATDIALRLSLSAERAADNFNIDNLVAPVDRDTGAMGCALRRVGNRFTETPAHPATGARIEGERLLLLDQAAELALKAHRCFADYVVIGWDIGLGEEGPVLIEGNWNPGYNVLQLVHGRGLGELRIGALYRHHLERAPAERWAAAGPLQIAQRPVLSS
jgi:hypothetical protein